MTSTFELTDPDPETSSASGVVAFNPTAAFELVENEKIRPLGEQVAAALRRVLAGLC
jgi:hypothetical protein